MPTNLTALGAKVAMLGPNERILHAETLLNGGKDSRDYTGGVCYEVAAYVRFLFNADIPLHFLAPEIGVVNSRQDWIQLFRFQHGYEWDGRSFIPVGKALGFYSFGRRTLFHVGISIGGYNVRGVNGGLLGATWLLPVNLRGVLGDPNPDGTFNFDGTKIIVYISPV